MAGAGSKVNTGVGATIAEIYADGGVKGFYKGF